jgi:hypothetical protein
VACLAVLLVGCGTIFDPAPYSPLIDNSTILPFKSAADATPKFQALANGYAAQRDALMRQQLLFDVPMIGLGAAAIVNPLFDGAKNVTLGLALGAAGAAGLRTYFGPQTKVTAYNAAWLSLSCASLVADSISIETMGDDNDGHQLVRTLTTDTASAEGFLTGTTTPAPSAQEKAALLAAYNQAQKSLGALETALGTLDNATLQLNQYALTTINTATNKVLANVQNVSAVTAAVAAAAKPTPGGAVAAAAIPPGGPPKPPDVATLTLNLQNYSAQADAMTQRISTVMGALPKCTPGS